MTAAKRSCSFVRQSAGRPPHLPTPGMAWNLLEGWSRLVLRRASSNAPQRSSYMQPEPQHRDKVRPHRWGTWIVATDGGVDVPKSAGVGILLSSLNSSEIIEKASINCGARPCSYRTESRALLLALEKLIIPRIRHRHKTLLVVTGGQSLLAAPNNGPLSQTDWTEDQIWQRLLTLTCAGWSVHLQFVTDIVEYMLMSLQISMRHRLWKLDNTRSMESHIYGIRIC
ncbi:hypothetical protein C3747_8g373 [Trypanosoma cruzi]|uniref:RNase H n=1 Tax=Trypanosoma cruzi TaxID=5693 RepID=A0A2V2XHG1_TRYCR|nr:hypothetical protein C3747_8g373 [Trypanosoma cruzi]